MATPRQLTLKQARFVLHYTGRANGNATEAARLAGYRLPHEQGRQLLRKTTIQANISSRLDGLSLSSAEILSRLTDQATASVDDYIEDVGNGFRLDLAKARKLGRMHCIRKIKNGEHGVEIELYDAQAALDKLGKYRGLWKDGASDDLSGLTNEQLERIASGKG